MPYIEQVVLPSGRLMLALDGKNYVLNFNNEVIYTNGRRTVRGRSTTYAFRSVEQMRYDFERDVQSL